MLGFPGETIEDMGMTVMGTFTDSILEMDGGGVLFKVVSYDYQCNIGR